MKLPNLVFTVHPLGAFAGVRAEYKGWSVICGPNSYGGRDGLYEVMGPGFDEGSGVEGNLTLPEVLVRIALEDRA